MRRFFTIAAAVLACLTAAGCGGSRPAGLKGRVTLDGAPVENGNITFYPTDASGTKTAAAIRNGEYEAPALAPGSYKVEVSWPKPTGKQVASSDPGFTSAETREAIPKKYNAETTLTADIKEGEAVKDFALTSK